MKSILGSAVFLASLFILRNLIVGAGLLSPVATLIFLACLVGIPLGGIVFVEGTVDEQRRELMREIEALRADLEQLRRARHDSTD